MADPITLHIYVMGLAMLVSGDSGKDVAVLLPKVVDKSHYAVLIYPCKDPNGCSGNAKQVHDDLYLYDANLNGNRKLLVFDNETFDGVELDGRKAYFDPPPEVDSAVPLPRRSKRPHHSWYTRWWFHMMGEVPSTAEEAADTAWAVSLPEIVPCATRTPNQGEDMFNNSALAGFLRIKEAKTIPVSAASEASMQEYETGMCRDDGSVRSAYVPTVRFGPKYWPFASPNQATTDIMVIDLKIDPAAQITLEYPGQKPTKITPYVDPKLPLNILIGNLSPIPPVPPLPCGNLHDFMRYQQLLDPKCKLPREPNFGLMTTRVRKAAIGQYDEGLPGVVKVVSLESGKHYDFVPFGGLARPICYIVTN